MANILVVEDDTNLSSTYQIILTKAGHTVSCASNGQQALTMAESNDPDIILLDMIMPEMDGLEFLQKYEHDKKHPQVQIVVLSNSDIAQKLDKAYQLGASRYILKSTVSPKTLINLIETMLSS